MIIEDIPPCPAFHPQGNTEKAFEFETTSRLGAVLFHLPPDSVGKIDLSSRLFEFSRHTQPAGVYMPVVREDRFFTAPVRFIGIPASAASRVALRVYDPRRHPAGQVRVELINTNGSPIALFPVMEYWALVSVTDWDTQQVILITAD